jgi:hypothetical protein
VYNLKLVSLNNQIYNPLVHTLTPGKCRTGKGKGKAIPLQAWTGPKGSRRLRLQDFKTINVGQASWLKQKSENAQVYMLGK